ncbi:hypothetical protein WA026_009451 [Henosepilachna vigintioctopunctata]|uniref:Uncharacterized protein n=1 Tax=Henosepilachna vigintioctopunctata TaxID=420089 RepID=A0AAW1U8L7_9CUCU
MVKQFNGDIDEYGDDNFLNEKCEVIHIGIVCAGFKSNIQLHTMLKSIYFHSDNFFHFHIISSWMSQKVLSTLIQTWNMNRVNVTFYDINEYITDVRWVPNTHYSGIFGLLKLLFPQIVPLTVTNKIIVLDTDLIFLSDIYELWRMFDDFKYKQALGIVENESNYYLEKSSWPAIGKGFNSGLVLYYIDKLKSLNWPNIWNQVTRKVAHEIGSTRLGDQDIINAVIKENSNILYEVPCYWNTQLSDHTDSYLCYTKHQAKVIHWNSPKKTNVLNKDGDYFRSLYTTFAELNGNLLRKQLKSCSVDTKSSLNVAPDVCSGFNKMNTSKWRTLLFIRDFKTKLLDYDVTFAAQLSFDRIQMIEELAKYWEGPISLALYITDPELERVNDFIEASEVLQDRTNIAYHAVFRDGEYYPINLLRNVGLQNIETPYVFLADIDFYPMKDLYDVLRRHIKTIKDMDKKALVIPAFETQRYRSRIPKNKRQLLSMLATKNIMPFRHDVWAVGHSPTNYTRWKTAANYYNVEWKPDFEPYIVVKSTVVGYDPTFMGFGWNKVSHIMELNAQGYEFVVLPDAFIVHKAHAPSFDIVKFRTSPIYRMCLQNLKDNFIKKLNSKYGKSFSDKSGDVTNFLEKV